MFSFGASRQHSSSQASSLDVAESRSNSESLSRGTSQATSAGSSFGTQRIAFEDLLRSFYGNATDAVASQAANAPLFADEAQQLFTGGLGFLDQLQALPGDDYLNSRISGEDQAAQGQIDVLGENLGRFFDERLMPAITSRGVSTGTLGGSRQWVSIGRAAGEVGQSFTSGVSSILSNSQAARDALAMGMNTNALGAASAGLNALPGVLGLAGAGFNAGVSPYLSLSQILGSPTVLSESGSSTQAQSSSEDIAAAISEALSQSFGTSQSTSSSKGKSFNFGFAGGGGSS
jgi:hypothetical protein